MANNTGRIIRDFEYVNVNHLLEKSLAIIQTTKNEKLIGETGTGKSTLVYGMCTELNKDLDDSEAFPLFEKGLSRDVCKSDLIGCDILASGSSAVRKGIVTQWLEAERGILHLTGFNYAEQSVIGLVETVADFTGAIYIDELCKTYVRSPEHYFVISYNPCERLGYSGTFNDNIATLNRFEGLEVGYLPKQKEIELMMKQLSKMQKTDRRKAYEFAYKFTELAIKTRDLYVNGDLKSPITTRNLINYAKLYQDTSLSETDIIEIASTLFTSAQRETFKNLFEDATQSIRNLTIPSN